MRCCRRYATPASVDIFVYNAGLLVVGHPLVINPDEVDPTDRRQCARRLPRQRRGRSTCCPMVAGSLSSESVNGDRMPFEGLAAYAMSKSALQGSARGLARDFGARGITVNLVQPGPTDTDMNRAEGPKAAMMHSVMAIKRHGTADEVASLLLYLAGPEARRHYWRNAHHRRRFRRLSCRRRL